MESILTALFLPSCKPHLYLVMLVPNFQLSSDAFSKDIKSMDLGLKI
jgi:hypothetical protein